MNFINIEMDDLLLEFKPLIHKTLHRLNIRQNHMDYEDFFQEMQIQLIEIFKKFVGKEKDFDAERFKFTAYAGKGLYWHGVNILQKKGLDDDLLTEKNQIDRPIQYGEKEQEGLSSKFSVEDFLKKAKVRLSEQDYILLLYIIEDVHTIEELAEIMNVSKDTIYQRKKRIKTRLQDIKEWLIN